MERDQDHVDLRELALGPDDDADLSPNEDGQEPD
jgi:hypothetical protein